MNGQTPPSSGDAALSVVVMAFYALTEALERSVGFDRADFIEQLRRIEGQDPTFAAYMETFVQGLETNPFRSGGFKPDLKIVD
jgi:3-hydroxyisobutyrate dehydrogenase-like beta-hydroxyacid dehydrogenase